MKYIKWIVAIILLPALLPFILIGIVGRLAHSALKYGYEQTDTVLQRVWRLK